MTFSPKNQAHFLVVYLLLFIFQNSFAESLEFPDGKRYDGNATHRWYLSERKCFKSNNRDILYESHLNQVWLGNAYASYVLWFGLIDSEEPPPIDSHIKRLKEVGAYGYDGSPYPQSCLHK